MKASHRLFRIFVSSTFSDLEAERDALSRKVFPSIHDYCARAGYGFQAIDLRWGIGREASLDQRTMRICLDELARCQRLSPRPNFLVLLGERYGWRPLAEEAPAEEMESIFAELGDKGLALAERWYRRDENAVPPVYRLQPRVDSATDWDVWAGIERELHTTLESGARLAGLSSSALIKYTASATEQEIVYGLLEVEGAEEHVFGFFRTFEDEVPAVEAKNFADLLTDGTADTTTRDALAALKEHLHDRLGCHSHYYSLKWKDYAAYKASTQTADVLPGGYLAQMCDDVREALLAVINAEISDLEALPPLERELAAHATFAEVRSHFFLGREDHLTRISEYLDRSPGYPLLIYGKGGSGKSTLLAQAAKVARVAHPVAIVIEFYIGATPSSTEAIGLLRVLTEAIDGSFGSPQEVTNEFSELVRYFSASLGQATVEHPIILFIDAIDQLEDSDARDVTAWLPSELPPNVLIVISSRPGEALTTLRDSLPLEGAVALGSMSEEDGERLLDRWLGSEGRRLQPTQRIAVLEAFALEGNPLHLKLCFEHSRDWSSFDEPDRLGKDLPEMLTLLYRRLERDHGQRLVSHALGYLACTRNNTGLTEVELLQALSQDETVLLEFTQRSMHRPPEPKLPVAVWARLHAYLAPYLSYRGSYMTPLISFFHAELCYQAAAVYLDEERRRARHATLADVFESRGLGYPRTLTEIVYHLGEAGLVVRLGDTLTSLQFLSLTAKRLGSSSSTTGAVIRPFLEDALRYLPDAAADADQRVRNLTARTPSLCAALEMQFVRGSGGPDADAMCPQCHTSGVSHGHMDLGGVDYYDNYYALCGNCLWSWHYEEYSSWGMDSGTRDFDYDTSTYR